MRKRLRYNIPCRSAAPICGPGRSRSSNICSTCLSRKIFLKNLSGSSQNYFCLNLELKNKTIKSSAPASAQYLRNLLLKSILSPKEASKKALAEWEGTVVFDDLDIESFKLLPAVYLKCLEHLPTGDYLLRAKGAYRRTWAENQLLLSHLDSLLSELTDAKTAFIVADEALRLTEFYDDLGIYSLQDLKLAAPFREKRSISQKLLENGWAANDQDIGLTFCRKEKAFNVRIYWLDDAEFEATTKDAGTILVNGTTRPILCLEEQVIRLCELEFVAFREIESRWQFVASEILNRGMLNPSRLKSAARRRGVGRPLAEMLQNLKDELEVEIPDVLISELRSSSPNRLLAAKRKIRSLLQSYRTAKTDGISNISFRQFLAKRWKTESNAMMLKHAVKAGVRFLRSK